MTLKHLLVATAFGASMLALGTVLSEPPALPELDREEARGALLSDQPAMESAGNKDVSGVVQAGQQTQAAAPRKLVAHSVVRRWVFPHGPKY